MSDHRPVARWHPIMFLGLVAVAGGWWLAPRITPDLEVTHVSLDVAPHKPNGRAWDGKDGLPDPKIELKQGSKTLATCPAVIDRLHVECDLDAEIAADRRDVRLIVRDEDDVIDDDIGEVALWPITNDAVVRDHADSIEHIEVAIVETSGWQRYGATLCAIVGGVAVVCAVWLMGLGRAVRQRDVSRLMTMIAGAIAIVGFAIEVRLMRSDTLVIESIESFGTLAVARGLGALSITLAWCAATTRDRIDRWDVLALVVGIAAVAGPLPAGVCALVALLAYAAVN